MGYPVWLMALCVALSGCGSEEGSGEGSGPGIRVEPDTSMVRSSDPTLRRMAAELLPDLAERSGLELREPVRVEARSRAELTRYLEYKLESELPEDVQRDVAASYRMLGLVPDDLDLGTLLLSVYTEQVAGFYDPDSTALFVLDDQPDEALSTVLIHELVHAVQDQAADLDSLTARERGNDRQTAAHAAIEGHATLVMMEYLLEEATGGPVDLAALPNFSELMAPTLAAVGDQYPELARAPAVFRESLLFPYLEGAGFVQSLWREEDARVAPFGDLLPASTEQILDPGKLLDDPPDRPLELELAFPDGQNPDYSNSLGRLELSIFLEEHLGPGAREAAQGWGGDRFGYWREGPSGEALAWVLVWDDAESRDRFVAEVSSALDNLPSSAVLEQDVSGRPGALFTVGSPPAVQATLRSDPQE